MKRDQEGTRIKLLNTMNLMKKMVQVLTCWWEDIFGGFRMFLFMPEIDVYTISHRCKVARKFRSHIQRRHSIMTKRV